MPSILGPIILLDLLAVATAQQAGTNKKEQHVPITFAECTKSGGCTSKSLALTMDAQWRWLHDAHPNMFGNCLNGLNWDKTIAKDAASGASFCALEGMDPQSYKGTYGVSAMPGGVALQFKNGMSIGSRLYMMEDTNTYKMFKLLNKEFTIDIDVSKLECGLNGAVYFVEMEADGGRGKGGNNTAGAKFGTGYCDAQCPQDLKFIDGKANVHDWHITKVGPIGRMGACCSEMDIWEANKAATAYTAHPCKTEGPLPCDSQSPGNECGFTKPDCKCCAKKGDLATVCPCCGRYKGVCDKDGCDYNSYRLGDTKFYGEGPEFAVDTTKPMTIVTQFLTSDNTDTGDLVEIRRLYVQGGKVIKNSKVLNLDGVQGDSITDSMCAAQKTGFENRDDFKPKGGLAQMGKALGRGVVLVLSLWDDMLTKMVWLDSISPDDDPLYPESKPGVKRGPCSTKEGDPNVLRNQFPMANVKYSNIMVGEIGSTYGPAAEKVKNLAATPMKEAPAAPLPGASTMTQPGVAPATTLVQPGQQVLPGQPLLPQPGQQPLVSPPGQPGVVPLAAPGGVAPGVVQPVQPAPGGAQPNQAAGQVAAAVAALLPGAPQPQQPQPQPQPQATPAPAPTSTPAAQSPAPQSGGGSPVCCTSSKNPSNPCAAGSCYPGSDMRTGFCVGSAAACKTCSGTWCANGLGAASPQPQPQTQAPQPLPLPQTQAPQPQPQTTLAPQPQPQQPATQVLPAQSSVVQVHLPQTGGGWAAGGVSAQGAAQPSGNAACCTSARNAGDPCGSCDPGSGITSGWCVDKQDRCTGNCAGHWCPNGIIEGFEVSAVEPPALEALRRPSAGGLGAASWMTGLVLTGLFAMAAWARLRPRPREAVEARPLRSELEPLSAEA